jgi:hypothetical protein
VNDQTIATLVGLAVFLALRVADYLLPKGRHLRFIDRWTVKDDPPEDEKG